MNKKTKIIIAVIAVPAVLLIICAVSAYTFVIPPSAEKACDALIELAREDVKKASGEESANEMSAEDLIGFTREECIEAEIIRGEIYGFLSVKQDRDCIINSETLEEAVKCAEEE
ncbi:MAG: hypothetical protein ACOCXT_03875 [Candidatus Dojkabacteria bacterium]